jgi:hypothetical protein
MAKRHLVLYARIDTDSPEPVRRVLRDLFGERGFEPGENPGEFIVKREMEGESAKDLNRDFLSALRRAEKKTRLHADWTAQDGTVYRFFDYVLKKETRP